MHILEMDIWYIRSESLITYKKKNV